MDIININKLKLNKEITINSYKRYSYKVKSLTPRREKLEWQPCHSSLKCWSGNGTRIFCSISLAKTSHKVKPQRGQ